MFVCSQALDESEKPAPTHVGSADGEDPVQGSGDAEPATLEDTAAAAAAVKSDETAASSELPVLAAKMNDAIQDSQDRMEITDSEHAAPASTHSSAGSTLSADAAAAIVGLTKQHPSDGSIQSNIEAADKESPAAAAAAASSSMSMPAGTDTDSSSAQALDSSTHPRISALLEYYRELSDSVVREGTAGWDPAHPGMLMTEWQRESGKSRPISLVWLFDQRAATARNDNQALASHLKEMPALPYWTWGSVHDGDEQMRALVLGDVAGNQQLLHHKPMVRLQDELERDPLWGTVLPQDAEKEDEGVLCYRKTYAHTSQDIRTNACSFLPAVT